MNEKEGSEVTEDGTGDSGTPSPMRATGSAASMKSSNRELFHLSSTPFTVTCTAFIVTPNCNRHATHTSTNFRPDTPVMLKRTFRHPVSSILCDILNLPLMKASKQLYVRG